MSNILKDLIKKALKEVNDAAMKKSAKGMAMYGKKAKMKEQLQGANALWNGDCSTLPSTYVGNDLLNLCYKCDTTMGIGSVEQQMNPSPCDCDVNNEPLLDFCRNKFPEHAFGTGPLGGTSPTNTSIGTSVVGPVKKEPSIKKGPKPKNIRNRRRRGKIRREQDPDDFGGGMGHPSGLGRGRGNNKPDPDDFGGGMGHPSGLGKKKNTLATKKRKRKIREAEVTAGDENTKFNLKVDVSNPQSETKLGVRIQLEPKEGFLEPEAQDNLETALMKKLNNALEQFDIQVSKDTDVPDPTVIGFFIPLSQIKNMIVKSIKGPGGTTTPKPFTPDLEKDALQRDKIGQMMNKEKQAQAAKQTTNESINDLISDQLITEMRQRTLNEISQIVLREDFYGFVNAGNNMLRSLEERGYDMREAKKYLGYLVKHNIM